MLFWLWLRRWALQREWRRDHPELRPPSQGGGGCLAVIVVAVFLGGLALHAVNKPDPAVDPNNIAAIVQQSGLSISDLCAGNGTSDGGPIRALRYEGYGQYVPTCGDGSPGTPFAAYR